MRSPANPVSAVRRDPGGAFVALGLAVVVVLVVRAVAMRRAEHRTRGQCVADGERWHITGLGGRLQTRQAKLFLGNAGTAMRFFTGWLAFTPGRSPS
mgnify:CR=1 FL=1